MKNTVQQRYKDMIHGMYLNGDTDKLLRTIYPHVRNRAAYYGRRYQNLHVTAEDFESAFMETVWDVVEFGRYKDGQNVYDTISLAIYRQAVDVVRTLKPRYTKKYGSEETENDLNVVLYLWDRDKFDEHAEKYESCRVRDFADDVVNEVWLEQCRRDLGDHDNRLLTLIIENYGISLRRIQRIMGYDNHVQAARALETLRERLATL